MELANGIFYRQYGDITLLRNVPKRMDYVFSGIVSDFLDYIKLNPGCEISHLCDSLSKEYALEDRLSFDEDMRVFAEQLTEVGILRKIEEKKTQPDEDLREQARSIARDEHLIFSATLEITYRCNEKCIHCYVDDKVDESQELTLAEYDKLLDELWDLGCHNILLTGGEITVRKDFLDIVEMAVKKGFCVDVYSNGLALNAKHIERLASLCVNSVSFSLYGPDAKTHDAITGILGSFERSLFSLMMCKCAGIDIYVKTPVMKQNYASLEELMNLGKMLGVEICTSMVVTASHSGCPAEHFRLMDSKKYQHVTELALEFEPDNEVLVSEYGHEVGLCGAGAISLSIDPFGNVMPCNAIYIPMGNIRDKSLREIWENAPLLDFLKNLKFQDVCPKKGNCEDARWCAMCLGSAYSENKTWGPTPDICLMAQGIHRANLEFARKIKSRKGGERHEGDENLFQACND